MISRAGIVLGIGMGGFIDGILFHQILQWHNMASAVVPPVDMRAMQQNMRWDGLFHAAVWLTTMTGIYLLINNKSRPLDTSARAMSGAMLFGWGAFNLVEGLIDHILLGIHHVRDLPQHDPAYDWIFLLIGGAGFLLLGWSMSRTSRTTARER